jgi:hypothetical protein
MAQSARIANTSRPSPIPCRRVRIWAPRWRARAVSLSPQFKEQVTLLLAVCYNNLGRYKVNADRILTVTEPGR